MMKINRVNLSLASVALLAAIQVQAQEATPESPQGWSGQGEAGLALASTNSNSRSSTFNGKLDAAKQIENWKHALGASGVYASSEEVVQDTGASEKQTTSKRWEAHQQSDYTFSPKTFWFESLKHERDFVGSFVYQASLTTGLGYRIYDSEATKLTVQVGGGYRQSKDRTKDDLGNTYEGEVERNGVATVQGEYRHAVTQSTVVFEKVVAEFASDNTRAQNDFGVQVKMSDRFALALAYQVIFNSRPTEGYGSYDRLTTANLVYSIK